MRLIALIVAVMVAFRVESAQEPLRLWKQCGAHAVEECKFSLRTAVEVAARCPFEQERLCLASFVETLSDIDEKAPFYSGAFDKQFQLGNTENYRSAYWRLSKADRSSIKDFSAWVGIQAKYALKAKNQLTPDTKKAIENAIKKRVKRYLRQIGDREPGRKQRRKDFMGFGEKARQAGNQIQWAPGTP